MKVPLPTSFGHDFFEHLKGVNDLRASWSPEPTLGDAAWVRSCQGTVAIPVVQAAFSKASVGYAALGDWCAGPAQGQNAEVLVEPWCSGDKEQQPLQQSRPIERRQLRQAGDRNKHLITCKFIFTGFDLDRDATFELVPRLIGRGGCNTRMISQACHGKVHVRGRGSRPNEGQAGRTATGEADEPLHLAFSSSDPEQFEEGLRLVESLLEETCGHFTRYCHKRGIKPVPQLYTRVC